MRGLLGLVRLLSLLAGDGIVTQMLAQDQIDVDDHAADLQAIRLLPPNLLKQRRLSSNEKGGATPPSPLAEDPCRAHRVLRRHLIGRPSP